MLMKTIRIFFNAIFTLSFFALVLSGCDDDSLTVVGNNLQVKEAVQTDLPAAGGNGSITLVTDEVLQAFSADNWLTVAVSGKVVNISAEENPDLMGRSTYVTIKAGTKSTIVSITQYGISLMKDVGGFKFGTDDIDSLSIKFKSNVPVIIEPTKSWISYALQGDSLKVYVDQNTTGLPRGGSLHYRLGNEEDSISVTQAAIEDYIGEWIIYGYNSSGSLSGYSATITAGSDEHSLSGSIANFFNFTYTYDKGHLILNAGQETAAYGPGSYPVYLCLGNYSSGYLAWDSSVEFEVIPSVVDSEIIFVDNGSWSSYPVDQMLMYVFTASPPSSSTMYGSYLSLSNPYMEKIPD